DAEGTRLDNDTVPQSMITFAEPVARGPVALGAATTQIGHWEVSAQPTTEALTLEEQSALAKIEVRSRVNGTVADKLQTQIGRTYQAEGGTLVIGAGPGQWHVLSEVDPQASALADLQQRGDGGDERTTAVDLTHGRAMFRLPGDEAAELLNQLCSSEFADDMG